MLDANGRFSCSIPLSHIFGFCRDIRKVIFGASHSIILMRRQTDDYALWHGENVDHGDIKLSKLALWMPIMTPSLTVETRLLSFMDHGGKSLLSWSDITTATTSSTVGGVFTWQLALAKNVSAPRHVFIALQNIHRMQTNPAVANDNLQLRSHMIFDQCGVSEVSLRISNQQESAENLLFDYNLNQMGWIYHRLWSYMGRDQNIDTGLQISQFDFKRLYPIYYFSLQHLDLSKHSVVDVKFQARVGNPPTGGFRALAIILSDKTMTHEGGGGTMRVIDAPIENL